MPRGIPKNGINNGWFKKGITSRNKGKKCPWAKNLPQLFKKGRKQVISEETRKKLSLAMKGVKRGPNPEHSLRMRGRKLSEEHKLKLLLSRKGKKWSEETRKKAMGRICSFETRLKISKANSKENHWNWKGGISAYDNAYRKTLEYKHWREDIFKRDNWTCQKCKIEGGILHPHHIKSFSHFIESRYDISNGITLCQNCHFKFHKLFGRNESDNVNINRYVNEISVSQDN